MRQRNLKSLLVGLGLIGLGAIAIGTSAGCYERTISAKGLGADQYQISEPYQTNSKLDDWLYGPQQTKKSKNMMGQ